MNHVCEIRALPVTVDRPGQTSIVGHRYAINITNCPDRGRNFITRQTGASFQNPA